MILTKIIDSAMAIATSVSYMGLLEGEHLWWSLSVDHFKHMYGGFILGEAYLSAWVYLQIFTVF